MAVTLGEYGTIKVATSLATSKGYEWGRRQGKTGERVGYEIRTERDAKIEH